MHCEHFHPDPIQLYTALFGGIPTESSTAVQLYCTLYESALPLGQAATLNGVTTLVYKGRHMQYNGRVGSTPAKTTADTSFVCTYSCTAMRPVQYGILMRFPLFSLHVGRRYGLRASYDGIHGSRTSETHAAHI